MDAFLQAGITSKDLATLNQCCIYLQVTSLADIAEGMGHYICNAMITSQHNMTFCLGFTWLNQGHPAKQEWAKWHLDLQLVIPVDNLGQFISIYKSSGRSMGEFCQ